LRTIVFIFFLLLACDNFLCSLLQKSLNFNPAAMLPGAAPPNKEAEPTAIGFENPADVSTLENIAKVSATFMNKDAVKTVPIVTSH
jgi:hypothetical protein